MENGTRGKLSRACVKCHCEHSGKNGYENLMYYGLIAARCLKNKTENSQCIFLDLRYWRCHIVGVYNVRLLYLYHNGMARLWNSENYLILTVFFLLLNFQISVCDFINKYKRFLFSNRFSIKVFFCSSINPILERSNLTFFIELFFLRKIMIIQWQARLHPNQTICMHICDPGSSSITFWH